MSAGGAPGATPEEREVKLSVDGGFVLPPTDELQGLTTVDHGDDRLRAVYWDTDALALAHAGVGLRHRNGVWTYKGRSRREGDAVVRDEVETAAGGDVIPAQLRRHVGRWVDLALLHPVAVLDTTRHHLDIHDDGSSVELVHDRVKVLDGARVVSTFAELEVEHHPGGQALADRVVGWLVGHGAVVDTTPKYMRALRALGHHPPEIPV